MAKHNKSKDHINDTHPKSTTKDLNEPAGTAEKEDQANPSPETDAANAEVFQQKYNELNDKYLRLYSDFDNYRKRVIKEKIDLSKTASEEVITGLLSILDDFERALQTLPENDDDPTRQGISLIYNKFKIILSQKGLSEIKSMEENFDTDFHEAIANIPAPTEALKNKILDVTQKGYILNGKVIRFAKVVVGI